MAAVQASSIPDVILHRLRRDCPPDLRFGELCSFEPVAEFRGPDLYLLEGSVSRQDALLAYVTEDGSDRVVCTIYRDEGDSVDIPMSLASFNAIVIGAVHGRVRSIAT